jgi:uncharacterized protein
VTIATGAFLNAIGILFGGVFGLALRKPVSAQTQIFFRNALGAATVFFGMRLVWLSAHGTFTHTLKQILIALLAIILGHLIGKILGLQKISNRLGRIAGNSISSARKNPLRKSGDGFIACTILFCAEPLGLLGAVTDGLSGDLYLLAVKAVMDGLATVSFMKIFGWPCALSAFPIFIFLGAISFASQFYARPFLDSHNLINSIDAVAGFIACAVALVIFEIRKVELANYLPALAVAPLLAWLFK